MGRAVELLKEYLDVFMTDAEAWEELAALYLASHLQVTRVRHSLFPPLSL